MYHADLAPSDVGMMWRLFHTLSWLDLHNAHLAWWSRRCSHAPQRSVHPSLKGSDCFFRLPWLQVRPFKGIDAKVFELSRNPVYVWRVSLWFSQIPSLESCCRVPSFAPWSLILVRNRARHLSSISSSSRPPSSFLRCRVDRGTRNIVPVQMNHAIAIASCLTCSFVTGKIYAMCHILASRKACTY